jgi:uncharacterized membrane protein YeaQ/YmgE (transglycosylase-associated protein family)
MLIDWIITIIVGGIIGWIASLIMGTDQSQGLLLNIIIGIVGSVLGRWLFGSVFGIGSAGAAGSFSLIGIFWGVLGAIILVLILQLFGFGRRSS